MSPTGFVFTDAFGSVDSMSFAIYFVGLGLGIRGLFPGCVAQAPVLWVEGMLARRCATVRNHPREGRMAVLLASSAKAITFWRLETSHSLVSRGRHGTL